MAIKPYATIRPYRPRSSRETTWAVDRHWADGSTVTTEYFGSRPAAAAGMRHLNALVTTAGAERRRHPASRSERLTIARELARRRAQARKQPRAKGQFR